MIGTILDKYEVLKKVGEGGMATVYLGQHRTLHREVAIKVLHPHLSSSVRNRARFAREARAIEHLKHPNILEIFDYSGQSGEDCYIITEFVAGKTLADLMKHTGRVPSEIATLIGIELCKALGFAHQSGILHRDLKPDNVMVRDDGRVKLMDFGIARFLDESNVTMTGALVGSPAFMSPEQAKNSDLDYRSDLFSLGTLLFYLCSGHLPFTGGNASVILKKIIEGERMMVTEVAPDISASLADAIEGLLQSSPEDRFNSTAEVEELLMKSLVELGIDTAKPTWTILRWCNTPEEVEEELLHFLKPTLLERGKEALLAQKAVSALRLFNRLLAIDEGNNEVIELLHGLHRKTSSHKSGIPYAVLAVSLAIGASLLLWTLGGRDEAPSQDSSSLQEMGHTFSEAAATAIEKPKTTPNDNLEQPISENTLPQNDMIAGTALPTAQANKPTQQQPITKRTHPIPQHLVEKALKQQKLAAEIETTTTALPEALLAEIEIRSNLPADIWINNKRIGHTRQPSPIVIEPGIHQVVLRSEWILDHTIEIDVGAGQSFKPEKIIHLKPKPAVITLDGSYASTCAIKLDGLPMGTIVDQGRDLLVENPKIPHVVLLTCGDNQYERIFDDLHRTPRAIFPSKM